LLGQFEPLVTALLGPLEPVVTTLLSALEPVVTTLLSALEPLDTALLGALEPLDTPLLGALEPLGDALLQPLEATGDPQHGRELPAAKRDPDGQDRDDLRRHGLPPSIVVPFARRFVDESVATTDKQDQDQGRPAPAAGFPATARIERTEPQVARPLARVKNAGATLASIARDRPATGTA